MKFLPKVWRLIFINIIFQFVACSSRIVFNENDPQNPFKNVVQRKFQEVDSFNFKSPAKPEQHSQKYNIILKPKLVKGQEILLAVTYGSQSETWTLSKDDKFTSIVLCSSPDDLYNNKEIHIFMQSLKTNQENFVELYAEWRNIAINLEEDPKTFNITSKSPATVLISHAHESNVDDRFVLDVTTLDAKPNTCMIVAVYNKGECPFHNKLSNVRSAQMWTTTKGNATLTIRANKFCFDHDFYVSVVKVHHFYCEHKFKAGEDCIRNPQNDNDLDVNNVNISIKKVLPYKKYLAPIFVGLVFIFVIVIIGASVFYITSRSYSKHDSGEVAPDDVSNENIEDVGSIEEVVEKISSEDIENIGNISEVVEKMEVDADEFKRTKDLVDSCSEAVRNRHDPHDSQAKNRIERVEIGLRRLKKNPKLSDNTKILQDKWFRRNRSKVYLYLVPLISIFYFIPSIQFAFLAKEDEELTGSKDLCYHNFKCQRPFWIFSDFNHVISNMSYWLFGSAFMVIVYCKSKMLPQSHDPKNDHETGKGILQQLSIFYAMGYCLLAQGFFSVVYHVCPTNLSLQYDTTMMYVMCVLCYVKIYQNRHPDATANAYSTMFILGIVVLFEAVAMYDYDPYVSCIVYVIFLVLYVGITLFIAFDAYYIGIGRLDRSVAWTLTKKIFLPIKNNETNHDVVEYPLDPSSGSYSPPPKWIRFVTRFWFAVLFCLINLSIAGYLLYAKLMGDSKNVSHLVLLILVINLALYLFYYIIRKTKCYLFNCHGKCDCQPEYLQHNVDKQHCTLFGHSIRVPGGTIFATSALILSIIAIIFYKGRSANRNLTPAQSRELNSECVFMDFYDKHDLWHFFSAAAVFMAFLALLTIDDDIMFVPREDIDVF